jgi:hypothetical protein
MQPLYFAPLWYQDKSGISYTIVALTVSDQSILLFVSVM